MTGWEDRSSHLVRQSRINIESLGDKHERNSMVDKTRICEDPWLQEGGQ